MNPNEASDINQIILITNSTLKGEKSIQKAVGVTTRDQQTQQEIATGNKQIKLEDKKYEYKQGQRVKSKARKILIGLIISLSAVMYGYSLKQITSVPIATLVTVFDITMSPFAAQSILIGILPIGSVLGSIITKFMIQKFKRLSGIYIFTVTNIGAVVLVNITSFYTLIIGRFLQGICIGYYTAIAPIYLKEIAPKQLRRMLGLFFSQGKGVGVILVIIIELVLGQLEVEISWRIILSMTAVFSLLQAILIFFFGSDTPTESFEKGEREQALKVIKRFYHDRYVEQVYNEYTKEHEAEFGVKETMSENLNEHRQSHKNVKKREYKFDLKVEKVEIEVVISSPNKQGSENFQSEYIQEQEYRSDEPYKKEELSSTIKCEGGVKAGKTDKLTYEQKRSIAYTLGVHLCVVRHFIGGNAIITQGGLFINDLDQSLGHYTSLIINLVQMLFVVIGLVYLQTLMGKKPMFLLSISVLSLVNFGLATSMIFLQVQAAFMIMCVFMVVHGACFTCPVWAYPSEIIPARQSVLANIMSWSALAVSTLVPPLITGIMPDNNPFPVFIFFGLYGIIGFVHVRVKLKESDGFSYNQIIKSFK